MKRRDHPEDLGVGGRIILECILKKLSVVCGLDSTDTGYGPVAGCWEHDDEDSGSVECGEFSDYVVEHCME
jgi:hypothetical protein